MDDEPEPSGVKSITLNEGDRNLVRMAATLLAAHEAGQVREDATEHLMQAFHDDLVAAHPGVDSDVIEEMAVNFSAALLLAMEQRLDGEEGEAEAGNYDGPMSPRPRVLEAIGGMLKAVDPRH